MGKIISRKGKRVILGRATILHRMAKEDVTGKITVESRLKKKENRLYPEKENILSH